MSVRIQNLMAESGVAFGTSGARGLAAAMTDRVCYAYTQGFLQYLRSVGELQASGPAVAVAGDFRPSTDRIMEAVARAVEDMGCEAICCGKIPSPAVALYGLENRLPAIMVTGSHIPDDRNGIKFNKPSGEVLKEDEQGMAAQVVEVNETRFDANGAFVQARSQPRPVAVEAGERYEARYLNAFAPDTLDGLNVGVYQHSAVGRDVVGRILSGLGAHVSPLGRSERFIPVDTEAIRPEDVQFARQWAQEHRFDSIVSTDGDSDRPLISDERGRWLRGDVAGILCARSLGADCVCTPVSCNTAVEKCGWFREVRRTRIGSPYVVAAMMQAAAAGARGVVGYEANGGFLLHSDVERDGRPLRALPTRDAVLVILSILSTAKRLGRTVSELAASLPARFTASERLKAFPTAQSVALLARFNTGGEASDRQAIEGVFGELAGAVTHLDRTDGLRITFASGDIIHLRPSGNAPELRCYAEAQTDERASLLAARALERVASRTG